MISSKASNWVDRGEPPEPTLKRILSFYLTLDLGADDAQLGEYAGVIRATRRKSMSRATSRRWSSANV